MGIGKKDLSRPSKAVVKNFPSFKINMVNIPMTGSQTIPKKLKNLPTVNHSLMFSVLKAKVSKVEALRIPVNQDQAPDEECFDQIVALLKSTSASTPIVFNCQAGISRSTTGMIIASLIKEFQLASELNHMKGIVPDDILDALKKKKLGLPGIENNR